jgi:hypothetical protein
MISTSLGTLFDVRRVVDFEQWKLEFEHHKNRLKDHWIVLQGLQRQELNGAICYIDGLHYQESGWRYAVQYRSSGSSDAELIFVSADQIKPLTNANIPQIQTFFSQFDGLIRIISETPESHKFKDQQGKVDDLHEDRGKIWISLKWLKRGLKRARFYGSKPEFEVVPLANVAVTRKGTMLIVSPGVSDEIASNKSATGVGEQTRKPGA